MTDPMPVPIAGQCFVTRPVMVDNRPVGLMYRQERDNEQDTGWRFLAGDETPEVVDDPSQVMLADIQAVAELHPDIIPLLRLLPPAAFSRNDEGTLQPLEDLTSRVIFDDYARNLCLQLAMNPGTYKRLREVGVTLDTPLTVSFRFRAPDQEAAAALALELREQGCEARVRRGGLLRRRTVMVAGTEEPGIWTLEKLNDWVHLMVLVGKRHGCHFDGWSTTIDRD